MEIENDFGHWIPPSNITTIPLDSIGFVYIISRISPTPKFYIGKKLLENKKKRRPLKGRVNSRRYKIESDWRSYTGSSSKLNDDMLALGKENFKFEILSFHPSKLLLAYNETKKIVDTNAVFSKEYYNEVINIRARNRK